MDATVDDFFNEINKISSKEQESKEKEEIVWQECYDELTGYSYFWNTDTDEVTWVPPKLYKPAENAPKKPSLVSKSTDKERRRSREDLKAELFVPPPSAQVQYSPSNVKAEVKAKVYSIHEAMKPEEKRPNRGNINIISNIMIKGEVKRKPLVMVHSDDDEEEKIELITEYGGDSDSDNEPRANGPEENVAKKSPSPQNESDNDEEDDDEYDLLAKIQQRAKELKTLGGELPSSVKNIIKETIASPKVHQEGVSGFSLVAGYNSESEASDSEGPTEPKHNLFPIPPTTTETAHVSTLFPITQPINVKDFISPEPSAPEPPKEPDGPAAENNEFDNKAFQRKRRIGISLVNNSIKRSKEEENPTVELGSTGGPVYPGFQKGGVLFVNPEDPSLVHKNDVQEQEVKVNRKETEDDYNILREKLLFLGEGREAVLPVQVMLIQAETLFVAMKEGGLKLSYLYKWLGGICSDLVKLEKEAAPEGWLLQWDRSHKRYYYQNPTSGVSQWKYPEPDVTRCDDAMDISTTPPPPPDDNNRDEEEVEEDGEGEGDLLAGAKDGEGGGGTSSPPVVFGPQLPPEPPSPPQIRSPTPPPPPIITMDVPLPLLPQQIKLPLQPPPPPAGLPSQPLPPGVDLLVEDAVPSDTLSTALDSFYSEIAEVTETPQNAPTSPDTSLPQNPELIKKKRKKVKLAQGLTMKKKGVSELVEKWKSVQKTYKD